MTRSENHVARHGVRGEYDMTDSVNGSKNR
jgi:hypothetical protein